MPDLVVKGGRIIDATGDRSGDVVVSGGRVVAVGPDLSADVVVDAGGCVVAPGLVDLHTHLRQPGREEADGTGAGQPDVSIDQMTMQAISPAADFSWDYQDLRFRPEK